MQVEVAIIGGGIAGTSCAAYLAPRVSVALIEAESVLGYHATGRSAAVYTECYDAELIQRLSLASRSYFMERAEPLGTRHPMLFTAAPGGEASIDNFYETHAPLVPTIQRLTPEEVTTLIPVIPPEKTAGGILEPDALNLDVNGILMSFVAEARKHGCKILTGSRVTEITREGSSWQIRAGERKITADTIVNAAGAWGDHVAAIAGVLPLGLIHLKRSAFTFDPGRGGPGTRHSREWPMVVDVGEEWYMKPEGGYVLGSAASELPEEPTDARPDEIDIALGIERINASTTLAVRSIKNQWAGLRTFTPDRNPAVGYDGGAAGFFWLVGQGGYGIHTSPGLGASSAGVLLDGALPESVAQYGITEEMLDPARFRAAKF